MRLASSLTVQAVAWAAFLPTASAWAQDAAPVAPPPAADPPAAAPLPAAALPVVPAAAAPGTPDATAATTAPELDQWITYKNNLQRTGASAAHTGLPLNLVWRHTLLVPPQTNYNSPLVVGPRGQRRLYFALDRSIYCIDGQNGTEYWHSGVLDGPVTAPITLMNTQQDGDVILAITSSGSLSAIRTSDGGLVWEANARAPVQSAAPMLVQTAKGPRIVVAIATGYLIAFSPDGAVDPDWDVKLGRVGGTPTSTPALSEDGRYLFVTCDDQRVYVIDVSRGKLAFSLELPTSSFNAPVVLGDRLVITAGTEVEGFTVRTGELSWRVDMRGQIYGSPAMHIDANGNAIVYCGAGNGNFYSIDAKSGRVLWRTNVAASLSGVPVVLATVILVGTHNGLLLGLSPDDGSILWQYRLQGERAVRVSEQQPNNNNTNGGNGGDAAGGGQIGGGATSSKVIKMTYGISSPASVVDGQVFVIPDNAEVYAFSTDPFDAEPPLVVQPSLSYFTSDNKLQSYLLDPAGTQLVPGRPPLYFATQLSDAGSGIDPGSIKVTFEQQEIAAKNVIFDPAKGVLTVILLEPPHAITRTVLLGEGRKTITVTVKDYRGNETDYTGSFLVDNTMTPPPSTVSPAPVPGNAAGDNPPAQ